MKSLNLDCHCHLDRYDNPIRIASEAARRNTFTIAVTNLPSHFLAGAEHVRQFSEVRLSLGMHPLAAIQHGNERSLFVRLLNQTSFVGEIGLDFSRDGIATRDVQMASFRFVAEQLAGQKKCISLHSRRAEAAVLGVLTEFQVGPTIFHWFSGPIKLVDEIAARGHYFSVNPAMIRTENGRRIIARIPRDRLLTETDGPYVHVGSSPAKPWDVNTVQEHVAGEWSVSNGEAKAMIWRNFRSMLTECGLLQNATREE